MNSKKQEKPTSVKVMNMTSTVVFLRHKTFHFFFALIEILPVEEKSRNNCPFKKKKKYYHATVCVCVCVFV